MDAGDTVLPRLVPHDGFAELSHDRRHVNAAQGLEVIPRHVCGLRRHKALSSTLRDHERDGIVSRTAYDEMPPRVEYGHTPLGRTLRDPLRALGTWAEDHIEQVMQSRDDCDAVAERRL